MKKSGRRMSKTKLATSSHNSDVKKGGLLSGENLFLNFQKILENFRSSLPKLFCKKGVLENFKKFTGKHLCRSSLLNKVAGLSPAILLKKETPAQVFSCEFSKKFWNTFSIQHLCWLVLKT